MDKIQLKTFFRNLDNQKVIKCNKLYYFENVIEIVTLLITF